MVRKRHYTSKIDKDQILSNLDSILERDLASPKDPSPKPKFFTKLFTYLTKLLSL